MLSIDSDLPCSSEIPNPYISNTVIYKKNDTISILSGYKNSTNYRMCEIFSKYSKFNVPVTEYMYNKPTNINKEPNKV